MRVVCVSELTRLIVVCEHWSVVDALLVCVRGCSWWFVVDVACQCVATSSADNLLRCVAVLALVDMCRCHGGCVQVVLVDVWWLHGIIGVPVRVLVNAWVYGV